MTCGFLYGQFLVETPAGGRRMPTGAPGTLDRHLRGRRVARRGLLRLWSTTGEVRLRARPGKLRLRLTPGYSGPSYPRVDAASTPGELHTPRRTSKSSPALLRLRCAA